MPLRRITGKDFNASMIGGTRRPHQRSLSSARHGEFRWTKPGQAPTLEFSIATIGSDDMSYKTILVHVDGSKHLYRRVETAARLAETCDAHLIGVALVELPAIFFDPPVVNPVDPAIEPALQVPRKRAVEALANFEQFARKFKVPSIETRLEENETARGVSLQARCCDLVVVGQYDPYDSGSSTKANFAETVILESGVPVLVVPFAHIPDGVAKRIVVSWNGSREAARAAHYALPLLRRAEHVEVAVFDPDVLPTTYRAVPGKDILEWLGRHGITASVTRQATSADVDIANALLALANDRLADLLVMGCYGHSRFRELVMGGVSREILGSMTLPVLMAH
jgi:nucleotide-binding universal stress UspA family protein